MTEFLTVREAAAALGKTKETIRSWCADGFGVRPVPGARWMIPQARLDELLQPRSSSAKSDAAS